ncbi:MAG: ABC transporter ATP-binding protein [Ancalomicrobiaceae bacterium]|nr:ABC transporter ATP-binding protein [Ancalomicrobiaceae bacterium]
MADVRLSLGAGAARVDILRGVDFSAEAGKSVAIVGPSGSGKSTLLMTIAGLERVDSGRITVAGVELTALGEDGLARFRRQNIGLVFQSFHLVPTMTALENVAIPLELVGAADAFARAREELALVGLGGRLGHYPAELSGGEQQRVAIARALIARPAIVIADEPTGNLDSATGRQIADLLFETSARLGTTLVLVTHDERLAERSDRIVHVRDGLVGEAETGAGVEAGA